MGRHKKKLGENTISYMVSIWSKEDLVRLTEYLEKEYNIKSTLKINDFPRWIFFDLPKQDNIIDKKFASIIRRDDKTTK